MARLDLRARSHTFEAIDAQLDALEVTDSIHILDWADSSFVILLHPTENLQSPQVQGTQFRHGIVRPETHHHTHFFRTCSMQRTHTNSNVEVESIVMNGCQHMLTIPVRHANSIHFLRMTEQRSGGRNGWVVDRWDDHPSWPCSS